MISPLVFHRLLITNQLETKPAILISGRTIFRILDEFNFCITLKHCDQNDLRIAERENNILKSGYLSYYGLGNFQQVKRHFHFAIKFLRMKLYV